MGRLWWLRNDPLALIGLVVLVALAFAAAFAGQLAPFDPTAQRLADTLKAPDAVYRFGTDQFGRDILSRVIHGTRISLGLGSLAVQVTVLLADAILIEASLSFLGIGVRPPTPTWGGIRSAGRDYVFTGFWWFTVFPGLAIFMAVFSLNVLGDGLRDFIDPTTRPRGS